jgi:hypothetical protein
MLLSHVALNPTAYPQRTDAEQRKLGEEYRNLTSKTARQKFVKDNATRYTQLSRLPYFDLVQQTVIDPMHNLVLGEFILHIFVKITTVPTLGLVKTHFYAIWVQGKILCPNHKLTVFHNMLNKVSIRHI